MEYSVMSATLVTYAYNTLAGVPKLGAVYASTITTPQGAAVQRIQGRNLPHRVFVRSASTPIIGSKNASQRRPRSSIVPGAAVVIIVCGEKLSWRRIIVVKKSRSAASPRLE